MVIKEPFGPWKQSSSINGGIYRRTGKYAFWISLEDNSVVYEAGHAGTTMHRPGSLAEAVAYVDKYIEDYYEVEKTTEQKLADALAEIELLKQELRVAVRQKRY